MLACTAAAAAAPQALAVTVSAETTPATIVYYGPDDPRTTRQLVHRLHLQAGPRDERFWLDVSYEYGASEWVGEFGPFDAARDVVVDGPGHLGRSVGARAISATRHDRFLHEGRDRCPDPVSAATTDTRELTLPAGSSSTIALTRHLALTHAPTNAALYDHDWVLTPAMDGEDGPVRDRRVRVRGPEPTLAGLEPARLELRAGLTGSGRAIASGQRLGVRRGQDLTLSGQLTPARRGERITIWQYVPGASKPARLATARVDRRGRFLHRHWRPAATGLYELYATYAGRPDIVEPTRSGCGGPKVAAA